MMNEHLSSAIESIRSESLMALNRVVPRGSRVALLDFPGHMNVGDHLIWHGELEYLRQLDCTVVYQASISGFDSGVMGRAEPDLILFHGGGSLGDTWRYFQDFRELIVATHHHLPIVLLPQSLWFQDPVLAERCRRVFASHPRLVVLVRDSASQARAATELAGSDVRFCPDLAFGFNPPKRSQHAGVLLVLAREDRERVTSLSEVPHALRGRLGASVAVADWGFHGWRGLAWSASRLPVRLSRVLGPLAGRPFYQRALVVLESWQTYLVLHHGLALMDGCEVLITDRLHAHVLACLLGIPHVVLDNSYGKVSAVLNDYSGSIELGHFAESPVEAVEIACRLWEAVHD